MSRSVRRTQRQRPRLLAALWLWAHTQGEGSARQVAKLCEEHDSYRWLCGGVNVNYHTLSDFRTDHAIAEVKSRQNGHKRDQTVRVSMTDPEAGKMKMADGGFGPAYNVQLAADTQSRAIVAVEVSNVGSDQPDRWR